MKTSHLKKLARRDALKAGLGFTGLAFAGLSSVKALAQDVCGTTPAQPEGPFYPVKDQLDKDNDLTFVEPKRQRSLGQVIYINGQVRDEACLPIAGALVDIWQACASGKYNHPNDPNTAPLDPNFQYWGRALTDTEGRYSFKTILPGAYPAGDGWIRPPHIHYKVSKLGFMELTTQLYFAGERYNDTDLILKRLPAAERKKVIIPLNAGGAEHDPGSKVGTFDVTLTRP